MRNTKTKGKTMTKALSKCHKRFIAHNEVQWAYADILEGNEDINEIKCNVKLIDFCKGARLLLHIAHSMFHLFFLLRMVNM